MGMKAYKHTSAVFVFTILVVSGVAGIVDGEYCVPSLCSTETGLTCLDRPSRFFRKLKKPKSSYPAGAVASASAHDVAKATGTTVRGKKISKKSRTLLVSLPVTSELLAASSNPITASYWLRLQVPFASLTALATICKAGFDLAAGLFPAFPTVSATCAYGKHLVDQCTWRAP